MKDQLFQAHVATSEKKPPGSSGFSEDVEAMAKSLGARVVFEGAGYAGYLRERWVGHHTGVEDTYWVFRGERFASSRGPHKIALDQAAEFRRLLATLDIYPPGVLPGEAPLRDSSKEPAPPVFSNWAQNLAKIHDARVVFETEGLVAGLLRLKIKGLDYWVYATGPDRVAYSTTGHQIASAQAAEFRLLLSKIGIFHPEVIPGEEPPNGGNQITPPASDPKKGYHDGLDLRQLLADLALEFIAEAMEAALYNADLDPNYRWVLSKERSKQIGNLLTYTPDEVDVMGLSFGASAHGTASRLQRLKKRSLKADKPIIFMPGDGDVGVFDEISNQMAYRIIDTLAKHEFAATEYWRNPGGVPPRAEEPAPAPAEELGWKEALLEVVEIIGSITHRSPGLGCEFQDHIGLSLDSLRDRLTP